MHEATVKVVLAQRQYVDRSYLVVATNHWRLVSTLVNVNAPVVATTSWWLHFSAQVVALKVKKSIPVDIYFICDDTWRTDHR